MRPGAMTRLAVLHPSPGAGGAVPLSRTVVAPVLALALTLAVLAPRYGYHRDELYFRMLPLRAGYVDQPPLLPALVHGLSRLVDELWAIRVVALLLACASVLVVALVAAELGGGACAQAVTAWVVAFGTMTLTFGHVLLTASVDLLTWPAILLAVVRVIRRREPRWWLVAGVLVGLETYVKWLVPVLVVGVLAGLLLCGPRQVLRTRWLAVGAAAAVLVALPNIIWQLRAGLPQLEMGGRLSAHNAAEVRTTLLPLLLVMVGPLVCWLWILPLVRFVRRPEWATWRFLGVTFAVLVVSTFVGGTQVYYPYPLLTVLVALGAVAVEGQLTTTRRRRLLVGVIVLHVLTGVGLNLPVLPVRELGKTFVPAVNPSIGDQVGWPRYVAQIDAVASTARSQDPTAVVLTSNYGEAGALDRFSRSGLPVFSAQNALWDLGPPPPGTRTVVVVGGQLRQLEGVASCTVRDRLDNGVGLDNEEQGQPVALCVGFRGGWAELWPQLRHLD